MLRTLALCCFCVTLLAVNGCGLGRKTYKLESQGNGRVYVAVYGMAGGKLRIEMQPHRSGMTTTGSSSGSSMVDGVKYDWEIKYQAKPGTGLEVTSVKVNGEDIAKAE